MTFQVVGIGRAQRAWDGYAQLKIDGKTRRANRLSYEIHFGPIADGLHVCHRCDNRACLNPDHLFLGTNADNMADKVAKGRQSHAGAAKGAANRFAKLTEADVVAIRAADGVSQRKLAEQFDVSQVNICLIRNGKAWGHI